MRGQGPAHLSRLEADLLLLHPPAVFDFRARRDVYFPFLCTSGDIPITPLYECFPLGFKALQRYLTERGHSVRLLNLATLLLRYPRLELASLLAALEVRLLGIDLHWLVHAQGSLAVAEAVKERRPDVPVILGGISSTYYAAELIARPCVDMVMRGYDTLEPMARLLSAMKAGHDLSSVPNLLWKGPGGEVHDNGFSHRPPSFGCGIDWCTIPQDPAPSVLTMHEIVSSQNSGCSHGCGWCGGSGDAFRRLYGTGHGIARKPLAEVSYELGALARLPGARGYHVYSVGPYNDQGARMDRLLDGIEAAGAKSVNFEQFHLPSVDLMRRMARASRRTTITLSPESHDLRVARLAGRGVYTNDELERWLGAALEAGIAKVDVWYFVGMPEQDERSVMETVEYCRRLLGRYPRGAVHPMICPMVPFLDPASRFFEDPAPHGYRLFARTLEEHRLASTRASLVHRLNYETRWLRREELVFVGFEAVKRVMEAKAEAGAFSRGLVHRFVARLDDAMEFTRVVHEVDRLADEAARRRELERLGGEIERRNAEVLYCGVVDQTCPVRRQIGSRWFDELGWAREELDALAP